MLGLGFMLSVSCHMLSLFTTLLLPPRPPKMPDDAHYPHQSQTSPAFKDAAAKGVQWVMISLLYSNPCLYITPTNPQNQKFTATLGYTTTRRQIGTPPLCWRPQSLPGGMCQGVHQSGQHLPVPGGMCLGVHE